MRTDAELEQDVLAELKWEPRVSEKGIGVTARNGVVTLRGTVPSYAEQQAALVAAESVNGVRAVALELEVRLPDGHERDDVILAGAAAAALDWDTFVPKGTVTVTVQRGWVTLGGKVEYAFQRDAARRAVQNLLGLRGITSVITVDAPAPKAWNVKAGIEAAIRRHAELDASRITVETKDRKVTLRGTAESWSERREAERAAWAAPGVTEVEDLLTVHA